MNKLRKFFVVSVMVLSVIAMSGVAVAPANAAASAGDLIKMEGLSSVYYLGEDGKRYVFPNESTYFSWYADFSGVVTIPASELQSYPLGGNVTMRPGTTLVKITTDLAVYAVEPNGTLRKIANEAQAAALYGTNWNQRIVDLADSFFTNYTIGAPLVDGEIPVGSLVKNADSASVYYWDGTNYRQIASESAMAANRFWMKNVLTVTNTITAGGTAITGMEAGLVKTSQGGTTTGPISSGSGVMISLNSMTPASQSVPSTVSRVPFTKVNFTASNDGNVVLESITVKRSGLSDYSKFDRVWAEHNGTAVTSKRALNSNNEAILTFSPAITVNAGQTVTLDLIASLDGISGNAALEIAAASAVSAGGATVTGSFPVRGNLMSFADYAVTSLAIATSSPSYSAKVGDTDIELGRFNINFSANPRDVLVHSITFRNAGPEDLASVVLNLRLENNGETVTSGVTYNGRDVTFNFNNNGLAMLKDDGNQTFYIKGDIIGKDSTTDPGLDLRMQRKEDLNAYERMTGFGVSYATATYPIAISDIDITSGAVSVAKKTSSPSNDTIVPGSKNVLVLLANLKADEAISAEGLKMYFGHTASGSETSFNNARLYVNNVLIGSFDPATTPDTTTLSSELIDSAFSLNKGNNEVKITIDVKNNATASDKFVAELRGATGNLLDLPEYTSNGNSVSNTDISGTATGATMTVEGGSVEVTRNDGFANNKVIIKGSTDVVLGHFAVKALNDAVRINSVSLSDNNGATTATLSSSIYDMKLYVDDVQIGTTRNFSGGATFSSVNYTIPQNTTKIIELRGSFDSSAVNDSYFKTTATFNAQDSLGKTISPSKTASTVQFQIKESGTLSVAAAPNTPNSDIIVAASGTEREVAQFRFTSQNDSSNITEIEIENVNSNNAAARVSSYKLYLGSTLLDTAVPMHSTSTVNTSTTTDQARFYISSNDLNIEADSTAVVSVVAELNSINVSDDTNKVIQVAISEVKAKGSNGGDLTVTVNSGSSHTVYGNAMTLKKTRPTLALVNGIQGGAGSAQELIRFSVTADSNEDLRMTTFKFTEVGSGIGTTTDYYLYEVGNSTALAGGAASTTPNFTGFEVAIGKGETKNFRVVANTSAIGTDKTFGITMNDASDSLAWQEYYVSGYAGGWTGQYIKQLPLDGGILKY